MKSQNFQVSDVKRIASLADIPVADEEAEKLAKGFGTTLAVVSQLQSLDVHGVEPTHQVTGLSNVTRDDVVDELRMLSQSAALSGAKKSHNGYIVVDQILAQED